MYITLVEEKVKTKHCILHCFYCHPVRILFKWQCIDCRPHPFLVGPDVSFYFWDLFVLTSNIEYNAHMLDILF